MTKNDLLKQIAIRFLQDIAAGKIDETYEKLVSEDFFHHNVWFAGDRESMIEAMKKHHLPGRKIDIKQCLCEDDKVMTLSHIQNKEDEPGYAVVHIFRFDTKNKIAEMWDTGTELPTEIININGAF